MIGFLILIAVVEIKQNKLTVIFCSTIKAHYSNMPFCLSSHLRGPDSGRQREKHLAEVEREEVVVVGLVHSDL